MFVAVDFFAPFAQALAFFYQLVPDYGAAIALFTLTVMIVLTPLTLKGTRSMMIMQSLQPEMKKLQAQYRDDRQKLNEELMKFYRENNINPLGGCLPLLIQLPIFWILYRVIYGLTPIGDAIVNNEHVRGFVPKYLDKSSDLYNALYGKTQMRAWGMDLSQSATKVFGESVGKALPYIVLIVLVAVTSIIQQRQVSGRNPAAQSNPQQQMLMKLGPIMITFFSLVVPGALVIYFFVSNVFRVGQQALISRTIYNTPEAKKLLERQAAEAEARQKAGPQKGGFFQRMLGDAMPQVGKQRPGTNGGRTTAKGPQGGQGGGAGGSGGGRTPPGKASGSGRTTPPKNRPPAARKKKRRK